MKAGFFHDSPLVYDNGKYYSRTLRSDIWERYLGVFDQVVVSTRVVNTDHGEMGIAEHPKVLFNPISSYSNPVSLLLNLKRIISEIEKALSGVDCAIVRLPSVIGWLTCEIARRQQKPVLIELVGCPWDAYRYHSVAGKGLAPFGFVATRRALKKADFAIYVTQEFLQHRYPTQGESVGVSNVNISVSSSLKALRLKKIESRFRAQTSDNFSNKPIILGSIGKVDLAYKGHKTAVESLGRLIANGIDVEYEIVGPGDKSSLQNIIDELGLAEKVRLVGPLSTEHVNSWLGSIDIYIQPSLTEGLPRSVVEAMSHGLPVFLSDVGGHPELVDKEFLFPAGDDAALSNQLSSFVQQDWGLTVQRNFEKSLEYEKTALQSRRESILLKFKELALKQGVMNN